MIFWVTIAELAVRPVGGQFIQFFFFYCGCLSELGHLSLGCLRFLYLFIIIIIIIIVITANGGSPRPEEKSEGSDDADSLSNP